MFEEITAAYEPLASLLGISSEYVLLFAVVLLVWEAVWKMLEMWRAAKNNGIPWFICIGIFNTLGILPILYLYVFSKKRRK